MTLAPGDHVDRYEVLSRLGSGGMGEVFRARDSKLEREVALKIVRVDSAWGTEGRTRLLREARAIAALSHPNVLAVFDVGEVSEPEALRGLPYIAMELVIGRSLRTFVGDPTVPVDRRIAWLRDVARGLAAAHDAGLVHRDVKPENVMVRDDGVVKVLDFGIARKSLPAADLRSSTEGQIIPDAPDSSVASQPTMTSPHVVVGTPSYMAPEQLRAENLDGRTDQFAWGVLAFELLTGALPWRSDPPFLVLSDILSREPKPPAAVDSRIPAHVSDAILRTLSKDPRARFPSMHDLLEVLGDTDNGVAIERAPSSSVSPLAMSQVMPSVGQVTPSVGHSMPSVGRASTRATRRWQRPLAGAVGTGAVLAVSALVAQRFASRSPRPPPPAVTPAPATPTSSAACSLAHGGAAWRYSETRHECIEIASPDCQVFATPADLRRDDVVWVGGLYPMTGPEAAAYAPELGALDLARKDFADALVGSIAREGGLHARPIAIVACDETADPLRAAHHLADDVEVPAVVGFRWSKTALRVIPSVFLPRHVLSFISISQAAGLTKIPEPSSEPRLVWRSTLDAAATAAPIAALVANVIEPQVRAQGLGSRAMKVALVHSNPSRDDVAGELLRELRFNGKSALENGDELRQVLYNPGKDPGIDAGKDPGGDDAVATLVDFAPNVIVFWGASFASHILEPLEARWAHGQRPIYVTVSDFADATMAFAGADLSRRRRFFGMTNTALTMTNAQLVLHYNQAHPNDPVTRTTAPQPSYDAFYTLAYAIHALGDAPVTGPALSTTFARLAPPGRPIDVGPSGIFDAFETLRSGGTIDLNGAIGSLDFDPATGQAPIDFSILCFGVSDRGMAQGSVESGLVYDSTQKRLTGKLHCP